MAFVWKTPLFVLRIGRQNMLSGEPLGVSLLWRPRYDTGWVWFPWKGDGTGWWMPASKRGRFSQVPRDWFFQAWFGYGDSKRGADGTASRIGGVRLEGAVR